MSELHLRTDSMTCSLFLRKAVLIKFSVLGETLTWAGHLIYRTIGWNLLFSTPAIGLSTEIKSEAASFSLIV